MLRKIHSFIVQYRLFKPGQKVLAAVSGGPDSIAMLHILKKLAAELEIQIAAVHVNHKLREEADEEEAFVSRICNNWSLTLYTRSINIKKAAAEEGKSIEEAARNYRYSYFQELRRKVNADCIATAHHQDDNAESVLLHLLRGAGIKGLRGIMPVNNYLVRPLLNVSKEEIMDYVAANGLPYRIDKSNYDTKFLRNRIRHELIPYLQAEFNPRIVENLVRLGQIASEVNDAIQMEVDHYFNAPLIKKADNEEVIIDCQLLGQLYPAYQKQVIIRALALIKSDYGWSSSDIQLIMNMIEKEGSAKRIKLKKGIWVYKIYNYMHMGQIIEQTDNYCYHIKAPGLVDIKETGCKYTLETMSIEEFHKINLQGTETYLDFDKLPQPVYLRSRKKGDKIALPGMKGRKKVKDYFIDRRIPIYQRNKIPLLAAAEEDVYAIVGYQVAKPVQLDENSKNILLIRSC